ncbi:MAG: hypothetical protein ACR2MK_11640 [Solirubrobacteraceae bacterium]
MKRSILVLAMAAGIAGCGNANVVTPTDVAQSYVYAIAEGNYPGACALLDQRTRETLVSSTRPRVSCPRLFARCLPKGTTTLRRDQSQLLYANTDLQVSGSRAAVRLSGTAAARVTKEVTLVHERAHWELTSPGAAIERCAVRLARDRRRRHRRRSVGG